jgi:MFS family permease
MICGVAQSSSMFIVGRAIAGLGASGLTNGALTIIAAIAPMHKRPGTLLRMNCHGNANANSISSIDGHHNGK